MREHQQCELLTAHSAALNQDAGSDFMTATRALQRRLSCNLKWRISPIRRASVPAAAAAKAIHIEVSSKGRELQRHSNVHAAEQAQLQLEVEDPINQVWCDAAINATL